MLDIVNKKNLFGDTSPHGDEISDCVDPALRPECQLCLEPISPSI